MNWNKCKNIVIFLLIIINVVLLYLNVVKAPSFKMTRAEEEAITAYLENNNVTLSGEMIKEYEPMRQLTLKSTSFSVPIDALFEEPQNVYRTVEFDKTIFIEGDIKAVFEDNFMVFTVERKLSMEDMPQSRAIIMAEGFFERLQLGFGREVITEVIQYSNYYEVTFFECVNGMKVFFNYVKINVDNEGVFYCEASKHNIVGESGLYRHIYSCDEMLLRLTPILSRAVEKPEISNIELGYFIETYPDSAFKSFQSVPFYKVSVKDVKEPFYVHGYTNNVLEIE